MNSVRISRLSIVVLIPALVVATSACGAIFNGTRQTVTANSSPNGARITTEPGTAEFTTPASMSLERRNNYTLSFEHEGYRPAQFEIQRKMQGGILALDILFTGLLGVVIDAATGAWYKLSPETATVSLTRLGDGPGPETIEVLVSSDGERLQIESSIPGVDVRVQQRQ